MKLNKSILIYLIVIIVASATFRVWGFAPQIALALFGGMAIRNKAWAFALPLFSLFLSDVIYEVMYTNGLTPIRGFYDGQIANYVVLAAVTLVGFLFNKISVLNVAIGTVLAPVFFFILSNLVVWLGIGVVLYDKTWEGLVECFIKAVPFFKATFLFTFCFSPVFFGGYYFVKKAASQKQKEVAVA